MKLPQSSKNILSIIGASIALINLLLILFLFVLTTFFIESGSYIGIFIYMILPIFLIGGLLMIPLGMYREKKRLKKKESDQKDWAILDFNKPSVRNATIIFIIGSICLIVLSSIGSFEAFHLTESNEFCGKLCHEVMKPEYTAYQSSSHERVGCVKCHVGSGASWYVKSKMSGLYQVYSVLAKKYPKPIPTPIHDLRPARETCEQCHWPQKFYDRKHRNKKSYLADEENTEWNIHMQMKTSASTSALGQAEGIHWHINPDVKIEYISENYDREIIPWVKFTNLKTNETVIYQDEENNLTHEQRDTLELRTMDCLDCHNRPSHNYKAPQNFIDEYLSSGEISRKLPEIKLVAMEILGQDFPTTDSALSTIKNHVLEYYASSYPELMDSAKTDVDKAILAIQSGFSQNIFPEMLVKWSAYPNHLGHMETLGCHRCHDDKHTAENGKVISRDCNLCHEILVQGKAGELEISNSLEPLEFKHPIDIDEAWKEMMCADCHSQLY